jgi:formylglycine-generating enzyme required for sulfatase activity
LVDVFISYPRSARAKVEPIKAKLDTLGLDCFFDLENIDGGANFPDIIDRALRTSKAVLCCWSPLYFERPWCMIECRDGLAREIMVPVSLERFDRLVPPADMRHLNYLDLTTWDGGDAHEDWNRTLHAVGKLVGRELAPPLKKTLFGLKAEGPAPAAPEAVQARADILSDLRATWAAFPAKENGVAVEKFLTRVRAAAPGSGLEFEVEHHFDELARRDAERRAREAAEVESRRKADEEQRARVAARSRPGSVWRDVIPGLPENACPEMVTIPPGKFLMGSPAGDKSSSDAERPQHDVRIDYPLALGKHAVTFAEWDAAIAAGAKLEKPGDLGWGRDRRPVMVNWNDAKAYIAWLNSKLGLEGRRDAYRLPSEAEWEYACRAGTTTPFSSGATISTAQANYDGDYTYGAGKKGEKRGKTTPVGSFSANAFGLHDMHGNVWEWCEDAWNANYNGAPTDGSAWLTGDASSRVVRGGSWSTAPLWLRSAYRLRWDLIDRLNYAIGFRVARTV